MKDASPNNSEQTWENGWDGHNLAQLRRLARLSLPEKIAWLEQAQRLVRQLEQQQPAHRRPPRP